MKNPNRQVCECWQLNFRPLIIPLRLAYLALALSCSITSAVAQVTTNGYLNQPRPVGEAPGTLLSRPNPVGSVPSNGSEPIGRTTSLNYMNGWLIVGAENPGSRPGSDLRMRVYDINNPSNPVRRFPSDFGLNYTNNAWHNSIGWGSHGTGQSGNLLMPNPVRVSTFGGLVERGGSGFTSGIPTRPQNGLGESRSTQAGPWQASWHWYGTADADFTIRKISPGSSTGPLLATFDHIGPYGGGDWHPMIFGDLLIYARNNSSSNGVVVYRLQYNNFESANPTVTPQFVAVLPGGLEAYWPNLFSDGSGLYVIGSFVNRLMAVDITAAAMPGGNDSVTLKADRTINGLSNSNYPVYQDGNAFIRRHKINMTKFLADGIQRPTVTTSTPVLLSLADDANGIDTTQMSLPLGNLWITGGYPQGFDTSNYRSQGMAVWTHQQAADTVRPRVTYHIPQDNRANYPRFAPLSFTLHEHGRRGGIRNGIDFTVRPVDGQNLGTFVAGTLIQDFAGVLTFNPSSPLAANTTYQVDFLSDDNDTPRNPSDTPVQQVASLGDDIGFQDAAGNLIEPYSFRFSTGSSVANPTPLELTGVTASNYQPLPGNAVTITAQASGGIGTVEYRYDFNGTWSAWTPSITATHTYTVSGRPRVLVQVRDGTGDVLNGSVVLLVIPRPASALRPTQSNTLAIGDGSTGRRVWTVNPDSDTVTDLNPATGAKASEFAVGKNPRSIARDANGRFWVTCQGSDEIRVLSSSSGSYGNTISTIKLPYGSAPHGIAASPDGQSLYVALCGSGRIHRYLAASAAAYGGASPTAIPLISAEKLPTARAIAISPDGSRVLVTRFISPELEAEVAEFNGTTLARTRTFKLAYANTTDSRNLGAGVPNYLAGIAISPDGSRAAIVSKLDNVLRGNLFEVGNLTFESTVRSVVSFLDLTTNTEVPNSRRDLDNSESPSAVAYSPLGDMLFVTLQGNNLVVGVDMLNLPVIPGVSSPNSTITTSANIEFDLDVGRAPQGVLIDATSNRLIVQNFMDRTVSFRDAGPFLTQNVTSFIETGATATVSNESLPADVLLGKQIFYDASDPRMSADSYLSCASCHVDGGHDGRVWDFTGRGEGLRRTIDLRGRSGLNHGRVHWSANFDEIQDFEHDIRNAFGGTGFIDLDPAAFATQHPSPATAKGGLSPELDALAAYVSSLATESVPRSPERETNGTLTAAALRGRDVFTAESCATCHSGTRFTNSGFGSIASPNLQNVGTQSLLSGGRLGMSLAGIDTPTLLGIHAVNSYLHHGQGATLDDVFAYAGGQLRQAVSGTAINAAYVQQIVDDPLEGGGGNERGLIGGTLLAISDVPGSGSGAGVSFANIDGGASGGPARIALRYFTKAAPRVAALTVNGTPQTLNLAVQSPPDGSNASGWRWISSNAVLQAGTTNVIEVTTEDGDVYLNAILVSNPGDLAAATPHRRVLDLTGSQRDDLTAYLRQLDGRSDAGETPAATTTTLVSSGSPVILGTPVTFTATVSGPASGSVTFYRNQTVLGTVVLDGAGTAALTTSSTPLGTYPVYASYSGNPGFGSSLSNTLSLVVDPVQTTPVVLYRETFGNAGTSTIRLNAATIGWQQYSATTDTANVANTSGSGAYGGVYINTGAPTNLDNVNAGTSASQTNGFGLNQSGTRALAFTTEFPIDRTQHSITSLSWYAQSSVSTGTQSAALRIAGNWYVTPLAAIPATGSTSTFGTTAALFTVDFLTAEWRTLTAAVGTPFAVGATPVPLPTGNIDAFGVYFTLGSSSTSRFDTFTVMATDPVPAESYMTWMSRNFSEAQISNPALEATIWGRLADPDGNGLANLLEYALGGEPASNIPARRPTAGIDGNGVLNFTFTRLRSELDYHVESGGNLGNWAELAENPGVIAEPVTVPDQPPLNPTARFMRLRVVEP